jgi:FkbM family methyltransferase
VVVSAQELKYAFIRTPLERPLMHLREAAGWRHRRRAPELKEIHAEFGRIEAMFRKFVKHDTNCIDVGCHYGSTLSRFCSLAPAGHHVAFEAIPSKARFLRRKFPDVEIMEMAVADKAGAVEFFVKRKASGFSSMARYGDGADDRITVQATRLDDVVSAERRYGMLKVDVEGAEWLVFTGARELLARDRPVILFECGPGGPAAFGRTPEDLYDLMGELGYGVYFIKDALGNGPAVDRKSFANASEYPFQAFNWVALPTP